MSASLLVQGVRLVASLGVAKVITDVVKTNTITTTVPQKVMVNVGAFVLGSMIMDHASKHVDNAIKAITEKIEEERQEEEFEAKVGEPIEKTETP